MKEIIKEFEMQAQVEKNMDLLRNGSWHLANETYCWLNAKHNTSVTTARQAEPRQHPENAKEWDLQTRTLLDRFTDN